MSKTTAVIGVAFLLYLRAYATCPVMLVSGSGEGNAIVLTLRNAGKLPIRELEFDCVGSRMPSAKGSRWCREHNTLFYPGTELTVRYPYPGGVRQNVTVSLKSATFSDGFVWKPTKRQPCRTLRVVAKR